ncbi:AraC family transcriptional regulator [Actinomycetes bacterium KLBMP 9797]
MQERYSEPICLQDLASEVYVSPFHFSRVFSRETGVTPGRYLTAVRLFEAKRLLLTTAQTVSDIVCGVGYSSVGTFTSKFTRVVGITPTQYREPEVGELLLAISPRFQRMPSLEALREAGKSCARVHPHGGASIVARIQMPPDVTSGRVLVGVFGEAIPQCAPVAFTGASDVASTELTIRNVPAGRWVVIAVAEHPTGAPAAFSRCVSRYPVTILRDETAVVDLRLQTLQPTDPPIAITLASQLPPTAVSRALAGSRHLRAVA